MIASAAFMLAAVPAFAQSNATVQGTQTAPGNASGAPEAASPAGQVGGTTTTGPAATPSAGNRSAEQQPNQGDGKVVTTLPNAPVPQSK